MVSAFTRGRIISSSGAQPLLPLDKDDYPRAEPGKTFHLPTARLSLSRTARTIRRLYLRTRTLLLAIFILWNILDVVKVRRHLQPLQQDDITPRKNTERIFIASNHWNDELVLRNHWNSAVLNLAEHLGPHNSFVSVVESGSYDDTKGALRYLDAELERAGVGRAIVLDETTHAQDIARPPGEGWVMTPNGTAQLRRIPYLSKQRNLALKPLYAMAAEGNKFDKILFLNDVVFSNRDIDNLLSTNNGDYAAACSLDFSKPPAFYDTFVLRDSEGHEALMPTWPYFRSRTSRKAIKSNQPVPVTSCWNGMVIMDATPFYTPQTPLSFRGLPDSLAQSHLEGSECCLIHTDNPLSRPKGVFVNPSVRVGYSGLAYEAVQSSPYLAWLSPLRIFVKLWENRVRRWTTTTWFKEGYVRRVVSEWEKAGRERVEGGEACVVNEMQILTWYGWKHV